MVVVFLYLQLLIIAWRWSILRRTQGLIFSLSSAFALVMIGELVNIVAPGSVGGDMVKACYVARGVGYGIVRLR